MDRAHQFFENPHYALHRQYEALRAYFFEQQGAHEVANRFGYSENSLYCFASAFKKQLEAGQAEKRFFAPLSVGRPSKQQNDKIKQLIIELRKKYLSVPDIKSILDTQAAGVSETYIYVLLKREGFARLPRRSKLVKLETLSEVKVTAPIASLLKTQTETFSTAQVGILCFLPYLVESGIDKLIQNSLFPGTKTIPKLNAILSFVALKLSNVRRYTADDLWCMDRGSGLFAKLNVLPKTAWYSSYSNRVTRDMNMAFLKALHQLWQEKGLLSDTSNLDFVAIPYWGNNSHLENNWSGTRHKALPSILAALAEDPDTGLITYGDCNVRHDNEADVAVEFLDFYKQSGGKDLKYLVFDSKFTTYENLSKLDDNGVKFVTIRRRGKNIVDELNQLPQSSWRKVRVKAAGLKTRQLNVLDQELFIKSYCKKIRQVAITGHGKIKPALIISNDFDLSVEAIIRKYARRWLVEKTISEQTHFFHLNKVSSSMVIKVDFDLTMTILAHNLYRLFALDLARYSHQTANSLYEKFIYNNGSVSVDVEDETIIISMKKKRNMPELLTTMCKFSKIKIPWLDNYKLVFEAASNT